MRLFEENADELILKYGISYEGALLFALRFGTRHNKTAFNDVDNWHRAAFSFIRNAKQLRFSRKQNLRKPYGTVRFIDSRVTFLFRLRA